MIKMANFMLHVLCTMEVFRGHVSVLAQWFEPWGNGHLAHTATGAMEGTPRRSSLWGSVVGAPSGKEMHRPVSVGNIFQGKLPSPEIRWPRFKCPWFRLGFSLVVRF